MKTRNSKSAKYMRSATAYARLAAKAHRNGNHREYMRYSDKEIAMRRKANRAAEMGALFPPSMGADGEMHA